MKSSIFTFALLLSSFGAFAGNTAVETPVNFDDEICYTATVSVSLEIPVIGGVGVSGGVEVTGCGATAAEARAELIAGIVGIL